MGKKTGIKKSPGDGYDRIEWLDVDGARRVMRADNASTAVEVWPGARTRNPGKWVGQVSYQGHYWCSGTGAFVFHESMAEFSGLMLLDHLHNIEAVFAQPMLLTFADGTFHYPDYLLVLQDGTRIIVDVHPKALTTEAHTKAFAATKEMCERLGWGFILLDQLSRVLRWNLEAIARFAHPRHEPTSARRDAIRAVAADGPNLGQLLYALQTSRPGENVPAIFHMLWRRELLVDLHKPMTTSTPIILNHQN